MATKTYKAIPSKIIPFFILFIIFTPFIILFVPQVFDVAQNNLLDMWTVIFALMLLILGGVTILTKEITLKKYGTFGQCILIKGIKAQMLGTIYLVIAFYLIFLLTSKFIQ